MYCTKCGAKLGEGSRFCSKCGTAVGEIAMPDVSEPAQPKKEQQGEQFKKDSQFSQPVYVEEPVADDSSDAISQKKSVLIIKCRRQSHSPLIRTMPIGRMVKVIRLTGWVPYL